MLTGFLCTAISVAYFLYLQCTRVRLEPTRYCLDRSFYWQYTRQQFECAGVNVNTSFLELSQWPVPSLLIHY